MRAVTYEECLDRTPLPRRVLGIVTIACLAVVFDGYDLQALAYALPKIVAEWQVTPVAAGLLASYTFVGLFIGAVAMGALGDRFGRKRVLIAGVVVFGLFMGAAGFAQNYVQFAVLRFLAALGMGGVLPGSIAMLSEFVPGRRRARMIAVTTGCFTLGFAAAAAMATVLVPRFGWRPLFVLSASALIVAGLIAAWVPETPQYLATRRRFDRARKTIAEVYPSIAPIADSADPEVFFTGRKPEDGKVRFRALFEREYRDSTIVISLLYLFVQFVVYALNFWMVTLLVEHGFSLVSSYSYAIEQALGATIGGLLLGWLLDRLNQRAVLMVVFAAGGVCLIAFGFADSTVMLYVLNALAGALIVGGQNVVHVLVMAVYGVEARASAMGWALGFGRIGALLGPLVGGYLLSFDLPFPAYFFLFAIPAVLSAVTIMALPRRRAARSEAAAHPIHPSKM